MTPPLDIGGTATDVAEPSGTSFGSSKALVICSSLTVSSLCSVSRILLASTRPTKHRNEQLTTTPTVVSRVMVTAPLSVHGSVSSESLADRHRELSRRRLSNLFHRRVATRVAQPAGCVPNFEVVAHADHTDFIAQGGKRRQSFRQDRVAVDIHAETLAPGEQQTTGF